VASAQPFPFSEKKIAQREATTAADVPRAKVLGEVPSTHLPLLARIPDVTIGPRPINDPDLDSTSAKTRSAARPRYRLDAAHGPTASASGARPTSARRAVKRKRRPDDDNLAQLSATIRFAVNAWEFLQPYQSVLRNAAMFLLMAASSMSVMLMMGKHSKPTITPPQPSAASTESATTSAKPAASPAEIEHQPTSATTLVPTATGPGGTASPKSEAMSLVPPALPVIEINPPQAELQLKSRTDSPLAARGPGAKHGLPASYPTTPYPMATLPTIETDSLPQVRLSEPAPAVARLRGDILESQSR
jgi:hypothetical protein